MTLKMMSWLRRTVAPPDALTTDSPAEDFVSKTIMPPLVEEKPVDLSAFADMVSVAGAKKPAEVAVPTEPVPVDAPADQETMVPLRKASAARKSQEQVLIGSEHDRSIFRRWVR